MMTWARLGTRLGGEGRTDFLGLRAPRVNVRWECEYTHAVYIEVRGPHRPSLPGGR